jgi:hypothetical protein
MPAGGIEQNVKYAYPAWVEGSKTGMDNMKKYMVQSEALNLIYASKFAGVANYWKNRQGMIDALSKFGTAKTKAAQEAKFNEWANKPENKAKYGSGLLERLSKDLKNLHGKGFSRSNLSYMRLVYLSYPICEEVPHKLTWNPSRFALKEKSNNPILNPKGTP